ncbi:MAG: family N-acetyltransferase [Bacteroidetes bacterium]|jgi:[ribosomal protein S5]-alanine N-acetyltransferase|nr:family N-acetyltransferase [Bacteroidota bacterium]
MSDTKPFLLRPWRISDAGNAAEYATFNVCRYMSDAFPGEDISKWKQFITFANNNPAAFYRAIEIDGHAVGGIGVLIQNDIMRLNAELGYWIGEPFRGRGVMTEAIKEMVALVFNNFGVNRIYATPFEFNFASQRVLEKAGFVLEAMFEKIVIKNGVLIDELIYAIRRDAISD